MKPAGLRVIGLTGGIASGKSSVAQLLAERGLEVIDADQLSRRAVEPGTPGLAAVVAAFGCEVIGHDGLLDRRRLGQLVFADPDKRRVLEGILHPEIRRLAEGLLQQAALSGRRVVVYMAPLLIEAGATDRVDDIWVVSVRPEVQLERLMRRDRISREEAERVVAAQMPLVDKERSARIIIDNNGTIEETRLQVEELVERELGGAR
jgi:dephospho-CoA kinase